MLAAAMLLAIHLRFADGPPLRGLVALGARSVTVPPDAGVVARIHGKPLLRRDVPRGDVLFDRINGQLLQEWAATKHIDEDDVWVRAHKLNQLLWREFGGGRVVIKTFGPEPFDANRRFLESEQKKRHFQIVDDVLRAAFWAHFDEKNKTFASDADAKRFMTTAWWAPSPAPGKH